jgi:SAM-dependent methyltransferase
VKKGEFDDYASDYDAMLDDPVRRRFARDNAFFVTRKVEVILEMLRGAGRDPRRLRWLDVGCGRGELLKAARAHFRDVRGCDVSTAMLAHAAPVTVVAQPDPSQLPFSGGEFDVVTAVCVFHHVEPQARPALLAEMRRVLTADGLVLLIEHNPLNPATRLIVSRTPIDRHAQLLSARRVRGLFRREQIVPLASEHFLLLPQSLYRRVGALERLLSAVPLGGQYAVLGRVGGSSRPQYGGRQV